MEVEITLMCSLLYPAPRAMLSVHNRLLINTFEITGKWLLDAHFGIYSFLAQCFKLNMLPNLIRTTTQQRSKNLHFVHEKPRAS